MLVAWALSSQLLGGGSLYSVQRLGPVVLLRVTDTEPLEVLRAQVRLRMGHTPRRAVMLQCQPTPPGPSPRTSSLLHVFYSCAMWAGAPAQCSWSQAPRRRPHAPGFVLSSLLYSTSCFRSFPQSLPVETLGPGSKVDPEPQRAPPAPWSPSQEDGEELAGTLDGEGKGPC